MKKGAEGLSSAPLVVVSVFEHGLREAVDERIRCDLVLDASGEDDLEHFVAGQSLQIRQPFLFPHRQNPALMMDVFQRLIYASHHGQLKIIHVPMSHRHQ